MEGNLEYTIEQFEYEFENAPLEEKREILEKALLNIDGDPSPEWKEALLKHKEELQDLKEALDLEKNLDCIKAIENGSAELYTCIKPYRNFIEGQNYYIKIDNWVDEVKENWIGLDNSQPEELIKAHQDLFDYFNNMRPSVYVYYDNGIGTLLTYDHFNYDQLPNYFKKFENNL